MPQTLFIKASPGEGKTITISTENDPNDPLSKEESEKSKEESEKRKKESERVFSVFNEDLYKIAKIVGPRVKGQGITFGLGMGKDGFKGSLTFKPQDLPTQTKSERIKTDIATEFARGDYGDSKKGCLNLRSIAKEHNVNIIFYESFETVDSTDPKILLHLQVYSNGLFSTLSVVPETPKPDLSATPRLYRESSHAEAKSLPAESSSLHAMLPTILKLCESVEKSILQPFAEKPRSTYFGIIPKIHENKLSAIARVKMAVIRCQKHIAPPPLKPIIGDSLPSMPVDKIDIDALLDEVKSAFGSLYESTYNQLIERLSALKKALMIQMLPPRPETRTVEEKQLLEKQPPIACSAPSSPMLPAINALQSTQTSISAPTTPANSPRKQTPSVASSSISSTASNSSLCDYPSHFSAKKPTSNAIPAPLPCAQKAIPAPSSCAPAGYWTYPKF